MVVAASANLSCRESLTHEECVRLLDRYTEALLKQEQPELSAEAVELKKEAARQLARREPVFEFDRCAAAVSRRQFECAMEAHGVDPIERCLTL